MSRVLMSLLLAAIIPGRGVLFAQPPPGSPIVFEGARVLAGDGLTVIENGAFVVDGGRFIAVGRAGEIDRPASASRVNLAGKTVMPAVVNAHVHLGYDRGATFLAANFTRENVLAQLERYARSGVAAVMSLGTDIGDLTFAIRAQQETGVVGGALVFSAGRGLAPPNAGPANGQMRPAAVGVTTETEARAAVRQEIGRGAKLIKIWVDDRNGTVPKLSPDLYRAIIAEAHLHSTPVIAHVYYLADARELAQAGVDGFAHLPRDFPLDEDLAALLKARGAFVLPNLAISENGRHLTPPAWLDDPLLGELVAPEDVARVRDSYRRRSPEAVERARRSYAAMQESVATLARVGVRLGLATDAGANQDHFHAFTDHRELQLMVEAGLTTRGALIAATSASADILGLGQMGRVAEGRSADFVVLDANPLEDITNTRKIHAVYLRGAPVDRRAPDRRGPPSAGGR